MTTITINPITTSNSTTGSTASPTIGSHPRRRMPAWIADIIHAVRPFLPMQSETPSDQAISTLSQGDRLGERR